MINPDKILKAKQSLSELVDIKEDKFRTMLETAAIITELMSPFTRIEAHPIVVGGLSVEIYTQGDYTTRDIDFVTSSSIMLRELLEIVEFKKEGHIFYREDIEVAVDVVDNALAGSYDKLVEFKFDENKSVYVISIEDIILDRLRGFEHSESNYWGLEMLLTNYEKVDKEYLRKNVENKRELEELERWIQHIEEVIK